MPRLATSPDDRTADTVHDSDTDTAETTAPGIPLELVAQVQSFASDRRRLLAVAEEILRVRCEEMDPSQWHGLHRRAFSADELAVFATLQWDQARITKEAGRLRQILKLQAIAGTSEDRNAATDRLTAAEDRLNRRGVEIRERMEALTRELAEIEKAHKDALADCEARQSALKSLRLQVSDDLKEQHERALRERLAPIEREIRHAEIALERVRALTEIRPGTIAGIADIERIASSRGLPSFLDETRSINHTRWQQFVGTERAQLPQLESKLKALKVERERATADVNRMLDCFAR